MIEQVELDEFAKEIEKEQLERWEKSQEKFESCKSVQECFKEAGNDQIREIPKCWF